MNNELAAIQKHLGIRIADGNLTYYTLLGLEESASVNEIKQALRLAANAWNQSDTKSDPAAAQSVAKLIKQAQAVLLDESRRKVYDLSLKPSVYESEQSLYPEADPFAPFDPNACLVGAAENDSSLSFGSPSVRWNELTRRIPTLGTRQNSQPALADVPISTEPPELEEYSEARKSTSSLSRIEQLRRKRQFTQRITIAGLLSVAMAVLIYAGIRVALNTTQIAQKQEADKVAREPNVIEVPSKLQTAKPLDKTPKAIGGAFAPKGAGDTMQMVLPALRREEATEAVAKDFTESNPTGMPVKDATSMAESPAKPPQPEPAMTPPAAMPAVPAAETKPMPAATPPVTATSRAEWVAAMKAAREAINKADFEVLKKQIEVALPLSVTQEMQDKHARLDQLGQLYQIFIKAVQDAKSKMRGAETLAVGRNRISIVEVKPDELVVRAGGQNERHRWDRLPPGIAEAMSDLVLSDQDPTDLAARAVYFSLSPAKNELYNKKVQSWFEKSLGKGDIRKDLVQALTETYE